MAPCISLLIRSWGVEVQRRLTRSRVAVVGLTGLSAEVCKCLSLAGTGRVDIFDPRSTSTVEAEDPGCFLVRAADPATVDRVSRDRAGGAALQAAAALREMNPLSASEGRGDDVLGWRPGVPNGDGDDVDPLAGYDLVIACGADRMTLAHLAALDSRMSRLGSRLAAGAVRGGVGWYGFSCPSGKDAEEWGLAAALGASLKTRVRGRGSDCLALLRAAERASASHPVGFWPPAGGEVAAVSEAAESLERDESLPAGTVPREDLQEYLFGSRGRPHRATGLGNEDGDAFNIGSPSALAPAVCSSLGGFLSNDAVVALTGTRGGASRGLVLQSLGGLVGRELR